MTRLEKVTRAKIHSGDVIKKCVGQVGNNQKKKKNMTGRDFNGLLIHFKLQYWWEEHFMTLHAVFITSALCYSTSIIQVPRQMYLWKVPVAWDMVIFGKINTHTRASKLQIMWYEDK